MMQDSTKEHVKVKYRRPLEKPRTSGRRPLSPGHSIADLLKTEPTASPNDCDGGESDTDDAHVTLPKPINAQQPGSQRPNLKALSNHPVFAALFPSEEHFRHMDGDPLEEQVRRDMAKTENEERSPPQPR
ncbi:hypothetical protein HPP92_015144 [Vanilla planifolia]|uniref:Uncharacterized protein n=1 Tax=Vanilla planifolia TaxID=51239 RepID=A0A835QVW7_VANPL|nr:hypothetical protein HPP92_015144 [Vanilla planifolia]